ncbi:MAG: amidase [Paracoccaceae bacterium]|jgi:amidase
MGSIDELYQRSDALALAGHVRQGDVSPIELVEAAISRIEALNPSLNAVICKLYDLGREAAAGVDPKAPLAGVPFLLKELASSWTGIQATNSSRFLQDQVAQADSHLVGKIKESGLMLVGKSNAPENGWSITTEPALYGATVNPWNSKVTAGGSSGGSSVAVVTGMVPIAEASDGAGSIRVPASCCGVVGLKPTRGRVSLAPFADYWCGGAYFLCNTRTVRDTAAYLDAVAGALPGDPYPVTPPTIPFLEAAQHAPKPLRVGYTVTAPDGGPMDAEIKALVERVAGVLAGLGHHVEEKDMALYAGDLWRTYTDMTCVETAGLYDFMETVVGRPVTPDDVEPVTWQIIQRGRTTKATAHMGRVEAVRQTARSIVQDLLPYDIYLTPTLTQPPRPVGFYDMAMNELDAYNALWSDSVFGYPFNVSGQPAMSLPLGMTQSGLPIGVQIVGRQGDEATLLALATVLEQEMAWKDRHPSTGSSHDV